MKKEPFEAFAGCMLSLVWLLLALILGAICLFQSLPAASTASPYSVDTKVYDITMQLYVPRVYNNLQSLGFRSYQLQKLKGVMVLDTSNPSSEPVVTSMTLANKTHKVNGANVEYDCIVEGMQFHAIGDNKKNKFKKSAVSFELEAVPSYNIGDDEPDNTLVLTLSGRGSSAGSVSGKAAGHIGCGCKAYGHVSPTRIYWTDTVVDQAACFGTWKMKLRK